MTYDHELLLITPSQIIEDEIGNQIPSEPIETPIYCGLKTVGRSEFYNAAVAGLRPELVFVVHAYEYDGQKSIKFGGIEYRVIRTYSASFEEMELTCERVTADG
jgi:hypothetical protein